MLRKAMFAALVVALTPAIAMAAPVATAKPATTTAASTMNKEKVKPIKHHVLAKKHKVKVNLEKAKTPTKKS